MADLSGKVALVTGSGRGIGLGCARQLGLAGAEVILNDRPGRPNLAAAAEEIRQLGVRCHAIEADVFDREGCESLVAQTLKTAGRIDILVSNPAHSARASFLELDPEVFDRTVRGTLAAGFHISQLVARHLVERGARGKIVLISSVQAEMPMARCLAYAASKAGLNHMMRTMAVELAPYRINVNAIEPGWIDTPGEHETFTEETLAQEASRLPWKRLGTPDDIGHAAAYLASDAADYVTGSVLVVDGGFRYKDCMADSVPPDLPVPGR